MRKRFALTHTFAGIAPDHVPTFFAAQFAGMGLAVGVGAWVAPRAPAVPKS